MNAKNRVQEGSSAIDTKSLVKRYARGNVGLQLGRYVTAEEKKARRERVLSTRFA
jgi:hypothetical protein